MVRIRGLGCNDSTLGHLQPANDWSDSGHATSRSGIGYQPRWKTVSISGYEWAYQHLGKSIASDGCRDWGFRTNFPRPGLYDRIQSRWQRTRLGRKKPRAPVGLRDW